MKKQIKLFTILSLALVSLGVSACETINGAGRDIEKGGEAIQRAAD